jgi:ABC-type transport system involved in cytochrome c biogenesis permease component
VRFLPIVERELRVAARQPRTWRRRVLTVIAALAVLTFTYLLVGRYSNLTRVGGEIFSALGGFGVFYAVLAGPMATADCLARERREGTLGLLFLTDLNGYDVVLGKMAAASFDMVLGLAAAVPLLAIPLLVGGVSLAEFARLAIALGNILFLSLAIGVLSSALLDSGRAAFALAFAGVLFLAIGGPLIADKFVDVRKGDWASLCYWAVCPFYTAELCLDLPMRQPMWRYWLNSGGLQALAWCCLVIASRVTSRSWRDAAAYRLKQRIQMLIHKLSARGKRGRERWRNRMLDLNPVAWLEGRDVLQEKFLYGCFLLVGIYCALRHLNDPGHWPNNDLVIFGPWWAHCILCLWLVLQAPRRLSDDKHSGALELLLCTPLAPKGIVRGLMRVLLRRYGLVFMGLVGLDVFLLFAHYGRDGGWRGLRHQGEFPLFVWGAIVFPIQLYSLARIGLYQGLVQPNSLRASFAAVWRVGLLPWALFFVSMLVCELLSRRYPVFRITEKLAFGSWGVCHLLPCVVFVLPANLRLRRSFRVLALTTPRSPWGQRLRSLIPRPKLEPASPQSDR